MNSNTDPPTFNLWKEPWITVEKGKGELETVNIPYLLTNAANYRAIFDPSPLVIVSIHRLLVAILQDIIRPEDEEDLYPLWEDGRFPTDGITQFGKEYTHRFDLFSETAPFLQSADIPLHPAKKGKGKSVGYLFQEENAGTAVTHYHHSYDSDHRFCAACCAKGLLTIPAFASSGGAGIKPSINGVPPIYILPGGETLFQSLAASLTIPAFQPPVADAENDTPWWRRDPVVHKKQVVGQVGYLHSLTFPARRVRLYLEPMSKPCSRCGSETDWGVSEMAFEMGEERPADAVFWQDPFAAYKIRKDGEEPIPIRAIEGKMIWREYEALFLPTSEQDEGKAGFIRPSLIKQLESIRDELPYDTTTAYPFQVIGLRTDMKAKTFEWENSGFQIPPEVLVDVNIALKISAALTFATDIDTIIKKTFSDYFGRDGKQKRHESIRLRLSQAYWTALTHAFTQMIAEFAQNSDLEPPFHRWLDQVQAAGINQFTQHAKLVGSDAATLEQRVKAISHNRAKIFTHRNKKHPKPEVAT